MENDNAKFKIASLLRFLTFPYSQPSSDPTRIQVIVLKINNIGRKKGDMSSIMPKREIIGIAGRYNQITQSKLPLQFNRNIKEVKLKITNIIKKVKPPRNQ